MYGTGIARERDSCTRAPRPRARIVLATFELATREQERDISFGRRCALDGRRSRVGARDEATSSKDQVMTYPYYVGILKHSPPTIYHGQGLA